MSAEVSKSRLQGRPDPRSRSPLPADRQKAIEAIRQLGDEIVSVTVRRKVRRAPGIAFDIAGKDAALLVQVAVGSRQEELLGRLRPNADLEKALEEGRTLSGRFSSAEELFDALEGETQT